MYILHFFQVVKSTNASLIRMGEDESVYRQIVHPLAQQTLKTECAKLTDFTKTSKFLWILLPFFVKILTFLSRNLET